MTTRLWRWAREILLGLVLLAAVLLAVDWLRAPQLPADFISTPLQTLNGQPVPLRAMSEQKPLLIYFWASWCGICRYTTPSVEHLYQQGGNVLSVAYRSGNAQLVRQWLAKRGYQLPVVNDETGQFTAQWQVAATPVFVVLHRGKIVTATTGWTSGWGIRLRLWLAGLR